MVVRVRERRRIAAKKLATSAALGPRAACRRAAAGELSIKMVAETSVWRPVMDYWDGWEQFIKVRDRRG